MADPATPPYAGHHKRLRANKALVARTVHMRCRSGCGATARRAIKTWRRKGDSARVLKTLCVHCNTTTHWLVPDDSKGNEDVYPLPADEQPPFPSSVRDPQGPSARLIDQMRHVVREELGALVKDGKVHVTAPRLSSDQVDEVTTRLAGELRGFVSDRVDNTVARKLTEVRVSVAPTDDEEPDEEPDEPKNGKKKKAKKKG